MWCQNVTDAESLQRSSTDPHSAGAFRVNGTVSNMPEFAKAFGCKAGDADGARERLPRLVRPGARVRA